MVITPKAVGNEDKQLDIKERDKKASLQKGVPELERPAIPNICNGSNIIAHLGSLRASPPW